MRLFLNNAKIIDQNFFKRASSVHTLMSFRGVSPSIFKLRLRHFPTFPFAKSRWFFPSVERTRSAFSRRAHDCPEMSFFGQAQRNHRAWLKIISRSFKPFYAHTRRRERDVKRMFVDHPWRRHFHRFVFLANFVIHHGSRWKVFQQFMLMFEDNAWS